MRAGIKVALAAAIACSACAGTASGVIIPFGMGMQNFIPSGRFINVKMEGGPSRLLPFVGVLDAPADVGMKTHIFDHLLRSSDGASASHIYIVGNSIAGSERTNIMKFSKISVVKMSAARENGSARGNPDIFCRGIPGIFVIVGNSPGCLFRFLSERFMGERRIFYFLDLKFNGLYENIRSKLMLRDFFGVRVGLGSGSCSTSCSQRCASGCDQSENYSKNADPVPPESVCADRVRLFGSISFAQRCANAQILPIAFLIAGIVEIAGFEFFFVRKNRWLGGGLMAVAATIMFSLTLIA